MRSCIASSSAAWVFGGVRLISSASSRLVNTGPALELEMALAGAVVFLQDLGADDVARHQVGRELDAAELQVQRLRQRAHQQRLAEARHAFEQAVAAGEQADQQLLDDVVLADDRLRDRGAQVPSCASSAGCRLR